MGNGDLISRMAQLKEFQGVGFLHESVILHAIRTAPAVDAVEVVRCKDCIAFGKSPFGHPEIGWCKIFGNHRNPDYYCASGRRKK